MEELMSRTIKKKFTEGHKVSKWQNGDFNAESSDMLCIWK